MRIETYRDFARSRSHNNPCVTGLVEHLGRGPGNPSTIVTLDYPRDGATTPKPLTVAEADLTELLTDTAGIYGRVLLVENIRPSLINLLGEVLDLDPIFFAGHTTTDFEDIEKAPAPPSLALFRSQTAVRGFFHLHFQQVLDLGTSDTFKDSPYAFKTDSNIPRNVRRLPTLSGRQLALARACCSIVVKTIKDSWICLILVDPPARSAVEKLKSGGKKTHPSKPLHGGFEDFAQPPSFSSFKSTPPSNQPEPWDKTSMLSSLVHYFRSQPPSGFDFTSSQPSILSLAYYPTRIFLAEWSIYIHLMSRYFKHYEYSLHDIQNRLHDSDISDLQRWRRRSMQSQRKLKLIVVFIDHWLPQGVDLNEHEPITKQQQQAWNLIHKDIDDIRSQLEDYSRSLEQMIPVATSMVQLLDSQRAMRETANVSRLTLIALVFVPLSWVASLFSMSEEYSPGGEKFWVYFATALPMLGLVLFYSLLPWRKWVEGMKKLQVEVRLRRRAKRREIEGASA